jgi:DNA polymerase III sliding clamp (beta) subunit (PCNA family)
MKIKMDKHRLMVIAEAVKPFIPKNPMFPILDNVLLRCSEDELIFTGSDNQNVIEYRLPISEVEISGQKSVCFNIIMVSDYIRNIKDENIELFFTENSLSISHSLGTIDIAIEPAKDFPNREIIVPDGMKPINGSDFCSALKDAGNVIENDKNYESRSNSIHIKKGDSGKLELFSSNGDAYRFFSVIKVDANGLDTKISIHKSQLPKLINFAFKKPLLEVVSLKDRIIAKDSNSVISIMGGDYFAPPYEKVDNQVTLCEIELQKDEVINCLDRLLVSVKGTDTSNLVLENDNDSLSLSVINTNYGIQVRETLKANKISESVNVAFDMTQLYKSVKSIDSEIIFIEIFHTAAKVSGKGNSDAFFVTGLVNILKQ